jgi:hypothetical protein
VGSRGGGQARSLPPRGSREFAAVACHHLDALRCPAPLRCRCPLVAAPSPLPHPPAFAATTRGTAMTPKKQPLTRPGPPRQPGVEMPKPERASASASLAPPTAQALVQPGLAALHGAARAGSLLLLCGCEPALLAAALLPLA